MGPLQQWFEALMARKQYAVLARTVRPSATEEHYELVLVDGVLVDITVEVETIPDRVPLTCSLGTGDRWIPQLGDTVVVVLPSGQIDFVPTIVAVLPAQIPNPDGQGPALGRRILVADEVLVHDGTGGAVPLALKSDVDAVNDRVAALQSAHNGHAHIGVTTGVGTSGTPATPANTTASTVGTTVLKGK